MKVIILAALFNVCIASLISREFDWGYLTERVNIISSTVDDVSSAIVAVASNNSEDIGSVIASQVNSSRDAAIDFLDIAAFMIDARILDLDSAKLFLGRTPLILEELRTDLWGSLAQLTPPAREEIYKILDKGIMTSTILVDKTINKIIWSINWKALRATIEDITDHITGVNQKVREHIYPEYPSLELVLEDIITVWMSKELDLLDKLPPLIRDQTLTWKNANDIFKVVLVDLDSYKESILGVLRGRVSEELYDLVRETLNWEKVHKSERLFYSILQGNEV